MSTSQSAQVLRQLLVTIRTKLAARQWEVCDVAALCKLWETVTIRDIEQLAFDGWIYRDYRIYSVYPDQQIFQ